MTQDFEIRFGKKEMKQLHNLLGQLDDFTSYSSIPPQFNTPIHEIMRAVSEHVEHLIRIENAKENETNS